MSKGRVKIAPYSGPAGGWGSVKSVESILFKEGILFTGNAVLLKQNKPGGFSCVSCAWSKPAEPNAFEYCENGAKATAWELTAKRADRAFFAAHTLAELRGWSDHALEQAGRLTHPMRWDPATDTYVPVAWEAAFAEIGAELGRMDPRAVVMYASGRAALETSYMWAIFARMYGTNNLPDSSNMCHESTSVALPLSIGSPVGTVTLEDFERTDCILSFGQNVGTNSPRMLHPLQEAAKRDVPIIAFNPLRERGWERFTNPQAPLEMITRAQTRIASQYHQVNPGGDGAAIMGLCKALIDAGAVDHAFLQEHTKGYEEFAESARRADWAELSRISGLRVEAMQEAARTYAASSAAIGIFGMGLTQHRRGVENVRMLANLLLLRGNIGKPGAGIMPVRGHSNVQGQRTVGITEKPELAPLDRWADQYGFEPPRWTGMNTVEACEGIIEGRVRAFLALGGNFIRAVPETAAMEAAWPRLRLSVQVATKLNRNHLVPGEVTYLLPCLGRIEVDRQGRRPQSVSMEDTSARIHGSTGLAPPASVELLSEPRIVAGLAKAALAPNPKVDWDAWAGDYAKIRDAMEATWPEVFSLYNERLHQPGGFQRPIAAARREWHTTSGRATFVTPGDLSERADAYGVLRLFTIRSNDQFNTTIYGYDDRFRGVDGTRRVVFIHRADIARLGLRRGQKVTLSTAVDDGVVREVGGLKLVPCSIPKGSCAAYFPECNPLVPLWHHAEGSKTPAFKSIPVTLRADPA